MTAPIKTNPDGAIDTRHYIAIGRQARSDAAAAMFKPRARPYRPRTVSPALLLVLVAVVALPMMI